MRDLELLFMILASLLVSAIIYTEVYNCGWITAEKYECKLISEPAPSIGDDEELIFDEISTVVD